MLGLIAEDYVRVCHTRQPQQQPVLEHEHHAVAARWTMSTIEAAILSLQHSFIVDNWNCGAKLGALTVTGAIAQKYRGPVGTGGQSASGTGFQKIYNYDDRLRLPQPAVLPGPDRLGVERDPQQRAGPPEGTMSVPPPSVAPPTVPAPETVRELVVRLEEPRGWRRRGVASDDVLRFTPHGLVIEHDRALVAPLHLPLASLALATVDPGPAKAGDMAGRLPVLRRLTQDGRRPARGGHRGVAVDQPRRQRAAVAGRGGRARTARSCSPSRSPASSSPAASRPDWVEALAARSPLGEPTVPGLLLRLHDTKGAQDVFRRYGLARPLTDREVPAGDAALAADRRPRRSGAAPLRRGSAGGHLGGPARHGLSRAGRLR